MQFLGWLISIPNSIWCAPLTKFGKCGIPIMRLHYFTVGEYCRVKPGEWAKGFLGTMSLLPLVNSSSKGHASLGVACFNLAPFCQGHPMPPDPTHHTKKPSQHPKSNFTNVCFWKIGNISGQVCCDFLDIAALELGAGLCEKILTLPGQSGIEKPVEFLGMSFCFIVSDDQWEHCRVNAFCTPCFHKDL